MGNIINRTVVCPSANTLDLDTIKCNNQLIVSRSQHLFYYMIQHTSPVGYLRKNEHSKFSPQTNSTLETT